MLFIVKFFVILFICFISLFSSQINNTRAIVSACAWKIYLLLFNYTYLCACEWFFIFLKNNFFRFILLNNTFSSLKIAKNEYKQNSLLCPSVYQQKQQRKLCENIQLFAKFFLDFRVHNAIAIVAKPIGIFVSIFELMNIAFFV